MLDLLAHTLTNRLLHAPTVALREAALSGDGDLARAADKLFPETGNRTRRRERDGDIRATISDARSAVAVSPIPAFLPAVP